MFVICTARAELYNLIMTLLRRGKDTFFNNKEKLTGSSPYKSPGQMVHLAAISYEGRVEVMNMVVSRQIELKHLKTKIDEIQIREFVKWKMMKEANIKV